MGIQYKIPIPQQQYFDSFFLHCFHFFCRKCNCQPFIMIQSFFHSTLVITVVVWSRFHVSIADEPTWSLRLSDTSRDGRFLNVPIYYGDWVPITRAKQTIEAVASKIEAASKLFRHSDPAPEIITADQPEDRLDSIVPYDPSQHHHYATQHTQQQHSHHTVSFVLESDVCNCTGGMGEIKLGKYTYE